jgi:hydroxymethylpyrimidine pyrophosphatase-like HAD family hydrolase
VIASGRHYQSIRPFLKVLPEVQWIVSVQGGEIAARDRKMLLGRSFMEKAQVELAVTQGIHCGLTPVVYGVDGVFTPSLRNEAIKFYEGLSGLAPVQTSRGNLARIPVFKVLWVGQSDQIGAVMADPSPSTAFVRVQTHRRIVEFMPTGVTKATGLQRLATNLKVAASETVAFGDAENDIPMFNWAGLSVAMAHGWTRAIGSATKVSVIGSPQTALARAIKAVIEE